jgi:hypothetical protein
MVGFPDLGGSRAIAKLDTGAFSGAIHCSEVRESKNGVGPIIEFKPLGSDNFFRMEEFAVRYVKSSNGQREKRYFIDTNIEIEGNIYPIVLSLRDRSDMKWKVLIGRKFLRSHGFVVDAAKPADYGKA